MNRGEVVVKQEVMLSGQEDTWCGETGACAGSDTCTGTNL